MGLRLYRLLVRLLPRGFREDFGDALADDAARRAADRASSKGGFWARECAGLVRVAITERLVPAPKTEHRRARHGTGDLMDDLVRETRFAARRLVRAPGFALAAVLTLALAMGAVTSIWAVVKNVVIDPLPYPASDRLVMLEHGLPGVGAERGVNITEALYTLYGADRTLDGVALTQGRQVTLTGIGDAEALQATVATPGLLRVLGVQPALGRWFEADAGREGGTREVVLSHALWTSRFGSDPDIVGRTVQLSGQPWQVIGVMPAGFEYPTRVSLWLPLAEPDIDPQVGGFNYEGIGRMARGVEVETLRVAMNAAIARLPEAFPDAAFAPRLIEEAKLNAQPVTLKDRTVGAVAGTLWVLLATVGLVLLLACANVGNLMLVRAEARQTELAVRRALGAGRRTVAGQYLSESLLLSMAGGLAGLGLAGAGVSLLRSRASEQLPRLAEVTLDPGVLVLAAAVSAGVGLLLGLLPLARRSGDLAQAVHEAGRRTSSGAGRVRARSLLMSTQVALACVLLVACVLMVRSFVQLSRIDPGFDAAGVLRFRVVLPPARYPERADAMRFHDALVERVAALPGVTAADVVSCAPLEGWCWGDALIVEGREAGPAAPVVSMRRAGTGYFGTLAIPVRAGRAFGPDDAGQPVAVVNRELARQYFPDGDAVGQRFRLDIPEATWTTIVGVIENTPTSSITQEAAAPQVFFPADAPRGTVGIPQHGFTYVVRTSGAPFGLVPALRAAVREMDGEVAISDVATLERAVADSGARIAFAMVLLSIAAATTLLLGAIGIYGVLSYTVTRRTGEIGVRLALGARPADVVGLVLRQGGVAIGVGLAAGIAAAVAFARFMDAILFGVDAMDPITFAGVAVALAALALVASWIPARRAAALDPVSALRAD